MENTNSFINNNADNAGGGIYWENIEPLNILTESKFIENTAFLYGNNIACFA